MSAASKKSETVEIRLSHGAKTAFMERCRMEGRTASEVLRLFIDAKIECRENDRRRTPSWRIVLAGMIGAALGIGAAAPSFAHSTASSRSAFEQLDRNHDGVLTYREFQAR